MSRRVAVHRRRVVACAFVATIAVLPTIAAHVPASASSRLTASLVVSPAAAGISKIKHVIMIMQENRSFDHYFGMYPGADGIPVDGNGNPTVCVNDPETDECVYPWHDPSDISNGGPHGARSAEKDINNGADGRLHRRSTEYGAEELSGKPNAPDCGVPKPQPDVMSYKLRADLPEYWAYADNYVLMDHMFGTGRTWSLPEHLFMVSSWSARCYRVDDPMSCENEVDAVDDARFQLQPNYAWTDVTHLLSQNEVSWGYYVFDGTEPDCEDPGELSCIPLPQSYRTGSIWNPLPNFTGVKDERSARQHPVGRQLRRRRAGRHAARGVVGGPDELGERARARTAQRRARSTSPT